MISKRILATALSLGLLWSWTAQAAYMPGPYAVTAGGTGLTSGTSGGVLYFNSSSTMASSAALTANILVKGGGAGAAPANSSITDNGTTVTTAEGLSVAALTASGTITFSGLSSAGCVTNTSGGVLGTSACGGIVPTATTSGSGATQTLATTYALTTYSDITVAAVWSLPAIGGAVVNGWYECLKDGTTGFNALTQTVKPNPTSLTIDGVVGTTGFSMTQLRQNTCFRTDGTNWFAE